MTIAIDDRTLEILHRRRSRARPRRRGWLIRRGLLAADVAALAVAFPVAEALLGRPAGADALTHYVLFLATLPGWIVLAKLYGLYDNDEERMHRPTSDDVVGVVHLVTMSAWLCFAGLVVTGLAEPHLADVLVVWALAIALLITSRTLARWICRRSLMYLQNALVVGAGEVGQSVARKVLRHPEYGLNLIGFVDDDPRAPAPGLEQVPVLGVLGDLPRLVAELDVERVVVAFSGAPPARILATVRPLQDQGVQVDVVPRLFELVSPRVHVDTLEGLPVLELPPARPARSSLLLKRALDIAGAATLLILTAPLFAVIAWRVKRDSPGPILFRQTRLGRNMREFTALKFRTMHVDADTSVHRAYIRRMADGDLAPGANGLYKLERADAITRTGRWLRRTSLDELPQLINVLRGDMSLVGPRPCIPYETETFLPHHFDRFLVPAGITGLWQVTARAQATFREALEMDVAYARGWSLALDLRLLVRTPLQVIARRGAA